MKTISEMTDEELNNAVAVEVMGWEYGDHFITGANSYRIVGRKTTTYTKANNWYPTTDYNQVFQVVEKMDYFAVRRHKAGGYWRCICVYQDGLSIGAESASAPRAICEAAVMAVRESA